MKKLLLFLTLLPVSLFSQTFEIEEISYTNGNFIHKDYKSVKEITITNDSLILFDSILMFEINNYWEENDTIWYDIFTTEGILALFTIDKLTFVYSDDTKIEYKFKKQQDYVDTLFYNNRFYYYFNFNNYFLETFTN